MFLFLFHSNVSAMGLLHAARCGVRCWALANKLMIIIMKCGLMDELPVLPEIAVLQS